jgi:hypothetical protein
MLEVGVTAVSRFGGVEGRRGLDGEKFLSLDEGPDGEDRRNDLSESSRLFDWGFEESNDELVSEVWTSLRSRMEEELFSKG